MRSLNVTVTEGVNLNKSLEFTARTCLIDNITASWLWVEGGGRFVPPFQYGVIVPLEGTAQGNVRWQTPVGVPIPTAGTATAQVTFVEAELPPANGQPVTTPSQQIPLPVVSVSASVGAGTVITVGKSLITLDHSSTGRVTFTVTVPPGANSVLLVGGPVGQFNGTAFPLSILVQGTTTDNMYFNQGAATPGANFPIAAIVSPAADTTLQIDVRQRSDQTVNTEFMVVASFGVQAVAVQNSGSPLIVSGPGGVSFIPVVPAADTALGLKVARIGVAIGASPATVTLIAAVAGQAIYGFDWDIMADQSPPANVVQFTDTSGSTIINDIGLRATGVGVASSFDGAALLAGGVGLGITNAVGGAITLRGHLTYRQQ